MVFLPGKTSYAFINRDIKITKLINENRPFVRYPFDLVTRRSDMGSVVAKSRSELISDPMVVKLGVISFIKDRMLTAPTKKLDITRDISTSFLSLALSWLMKKYKNEPSITKEAVPGRRRASILAGEAKTVDSEKLRIIKTIKTSNLLVDIPISLSTIILISLNIESRATSKNNKISFGVSKGLVKIGK